MYLSENPISPSTDGILLNVGDSISFNTTDGDEPQLQRWAVGSGGNAVVSVIEEYAGREPPTA